jgi:polyisoprenoid-binding protein YceI
MNRILLLLVASTALFACGDSTPKSADWDPSGCDCYSYLAGRDREASKDSICLVRMENERFKAEYVKCNYAALMHKDTSEVDLPENRLPQVEVPADGVYLVDSEVSVIRWKGKKAIVAFEHGGTLNFGANNTLEVRDGQISGGTLTVDMSSLKCLDKMEDAKKTKLENHLKGVDFFNVKKFPTATFKMTSVSGTMPQATVAGELTIKGQTHPATAELQAANSQGSMMVIAGTLIFDRTAFGVTYGSGSFFDDLGDGVIADEITLTIGIKASKQ